jgi:hypothetical protein
LPTLTDIFKDWRFENSTLLEMIQIFTFCPPSQIFSKNWRFENSTLLEMIQILPTLTAFLKDWGFENNTLPKMIQANSFHPLPQLIFKD